MAWTYHVYIVNPGDEKILVEHVFYSPVTGTKEECLDYYNEHLGSCSYFKAAAEDGRIDTWWDQVAEEDLPSIEGAEEPESESPSG